MKKYIFIALAAISTSAVAETANTIYTYNESCKSVALKAKEDKNINAQTALNLEMDLEELGPQIDLIFNESEDADFRLMVFDTAESTRQSLEWDLTEIYNVNPALTAEIFSSCSIEGLSVPLVERYADQLSKLMEQADGLDESI